MLPKRELNCVDVVKLVMAIVVIGIHTHPLEYVDNEILKFISTICCSCAVPFFFMATGYLLMRKLDGESLNKKINIVQRSIIKTGRLYIVYSIVYFPLKIVLFNESSTDWMHFFLGYIRDCFFYGSYFVLWYLLSALYALVFIYYLIKRGWSVNGVIVLSFVVYICGYLFDIFLSYQGYLPSIIMQIRHVLFKIFISGRLTTAFLYLSLGMFVYQHYGFFKNNFFLCLVFGGIGVFFMPHFIGGYLATCCCVIGIFTFSLNIKLKNNLLYLHFRKMSVWMYFMHMYILSIYSYWENGAAHMYVHGIKSFVVVTVLCVLAYCFWSFSIKVMRKYALFKRSDIY